MFEVKKIHQRYLFGAYIFAMHSEWIIMEKLENAIKNVFSTLK